MNFWIFSLVLALAGSGAVKAIQTPTCPQFPASFIAVIDEKIDAPDSFFNSDPDLSYLKEVLKLRDDAIQHTIDDAIKFLNETYGLDFSLSPPEEQNEYIFENARLRPFRFADISYIVTVNNWIQTGSTRSTCYQIRDGGFTVSFSADQILRGSYGGADGILAGGTEFMNYGFYVINVCQQSPIVIQYQSASPVRQEPTD